MWLFINLFVNSDVTHLIKGPFLLNTAYPGSNVYKIYEYTDVVLLQEDFLTNSETKVEH